MIGLLLPAVGELQAVDVGDWDAAARAEHLDRPRTLTWREFRIPGTHHPSGTARMFYDRECWAGGKSLPRNEAATRLVTGQLSGSSYIARSALVLRSVPGRPGRGNHRQLESLTVQDMFALATLLVLNEQRGLEAPRKAQ